MLRITVTLVAMIASTSVVGVDVLNAMSSASIFDDLNIGPPLKVDVLEVKFDGTDFLPGKKFYKDQVANEPEVSFPNADGQSNYTLLMVDPDAPSRDNPLRRSWLHWMIVNIPGGAIKAGQIKCGFNPSTPPPNTGYHRYAFLLHKQEQPLDDVEACANRGGFDVSGFVAKSRFGELAAGNYYEARNEPF